MKFSNNSIKELETCHADLVRLFSEVIEVTPLDFTIVQGARSIEQARENFKKGVSKLDPDKGQYSKHIVGEEVGREKSLAVDICPYQHGLKWDNEPAFYVIAGLVSATAQKLGIKIRYGGGWDLHKGVNHLNTQDQLMDLGHFELI